MSKKNLIISDFKNINFDFKKYNNIFLFIKKHIKQDTKTLIWVSWWPDSMFLSVLIYNFYCKQWFDTKNIYYLHCNHKVRKKSDKEEIFVKNFFHSENIIIKKNIWNNFHTENEMRKRRYSQYNSILEKKNIDLLLLWHNLTDRVETSFLNMLYWCEIQWFLWIKQIEKNHNLVNKTIIRPILNIAKQEIENINKNLWIKYMIDKSNFNKKTSLRNFIRIKILKKLYNLSKNKKIEENTFLNSFLSIYNNLEKKISDTNFELIEIKSSKYWNAEFTFLLKNKLELKLDDIVSLLKELKIYSNITKNFLIELNSFLNKKTWKYKFFNWTYFFSSHWKIYIIQAEKNFWKKTIDKNLLIEKTSFEFDWNKITLEKKYLWKTIRYPQNFDKYWKKSLSKIFINKKIPIFRRNFIPVISDWKKILKIIKY